MSDTLPTTGEQAPNRHDETPRHGEALGREHDGAQDRLQQDGTVPQQGGHLQDGSRTDGGLRRGHSDLGATDVPDDGLATHERPRADEHAGTAPDQHTGERPGGRAEAMSAPTSTDSTGEARLIPEARSGEYRQRWEALKASFVDEPRGAVRDANALVGQVLDDLEELFTTQRNDLERDLQDERASTEDLRQALGRYRSFFDRLLTV